MDKLFVVVQAMLFKNTNQAAFEKLGGTDGPTKAAQVLKFLESNHGIKPIMKPEQLAFGGE